MPVDPEVLEHIRRATSQKPVKVYQRAPREADGGENELGAYKQGGGYALALKVRGKWVPISGGAAAPAAPSGSAGVVVVQQGTAVDPLPSQAGHAGGYLTTDGSVASWAEILAGSGTLDMGGIADGGAGVFDMGAIA